MANKQNPPPRKRGTGGNRGAQQTQRAVQQAARTYHRASSGQKTGIIVAAVLVVAVLAAVVLWVPGAKQAVYDALGITGPAASAAQEIRSATKVHIIDVGQGDAVLLEQGGEFALVDAGPPECRDDLLAYLEGVGVQKLRYVFMTHPHADHIGAMQAVIERFPTDTMMLPVLEKAPTPTTKAFENLLTSLVENNVPTETIALDASYPLGSGHVTVLQDGVETGDNYNLLSPALLFEADGLRFLNTGDAEKANERALLERGLSLRVDVFMAGHHGSSTSNTENFLDAMHPRVVAISCGKDNSYGHPHLEAMQAFEAQEATILRTDEDGSIVIGQDEAGNLAYAVTNTATPAAAVCVPLPVALWQRAA